MADEKMKSESVNELAAALAKAQGVLTDARRDSINPFFKSKYADLASIWEVCRKPLSDNGLSVLQFIEKENDKQVLTTVLLHSSGQYFTSRLELIIKGEINMQSIGSAITYARRYSLSSMVGVCSDEDDDAESTVTRTPTATAQKPTEPIKDTTPKAIVPPNEGGVANKAITADRLKLKKAMGVHGFTYYSDLRKKYPDLPADFTTLTTEQIAELIKRIEPQENK